MEFFDEYLKYVGETEAPMLYHRWCSIVMVSAILGRETWLPFGHSKIYPNQFVLLMGAPGARKGTAINIARKLLERAGYDTFSPDRTSLEMYLAGMIPKLDIDDDLESLVLDAASESFICTGEFLDFIGHGNMDFLTLLTNLWDNKQEYKHPKLTSKSIVVHKPTINILDAATVKGLGLAIPQEALGTGVLSRIILVHSHPTGKQIDDPAEPEEGADRWLVARLLDIKAKIKGRIGRSEEAKEVLGKIYRGHPGIEDTRFSDYSSRRFTHLIKVCIALSAMDMRTEISATDVLQANTILHATERRMSDALGEFGRSKYSDASNTILGILNAATKPVTSTKLWKAVAKDLTKQSELHEIMRNLHAADKVQVMTVLGVQGYMTRHVVGKEWDKGLLLDGFLTMEEGR